MTEIDCEIGQGIEHKEFDISHYCIEDSERSFAEIIGCIENIVISDKFYHVQKNFLEKYYNEFVEDEENRLIYMDIFNNYLATVEKYIEQELVKNIPSFNMRSFEDELGHKSNQLDGEIFEMLSTFWDFNKFKKMFLDYKTLQETVDLLNNRCILDFHCLYLLVLITFQLMKEGHAVDFSKDILVTKYDFKTD